MKYIGIDIKDASEDLIRDTINMRLRPMDVLECRLAGEPNTRKAIGNGIHLSVGHHCMIGLNTDTQKPEFVWGVASTNDPAIGSPWLLGTSDFKITKDWLKVCRRDIFPKMNDTFPILRNFVSKHNHKAISWLKWLGFTFYDIPVSFSDDGSTAEVLLFTKLGGKPCAHQQQ